LTSSQIILLGAIAGSTILLGLPIGRLRGVDLRIKAALSAIATGILLFLFWDVLTNGIQPIESALETARAGGSWGRFAGLAAVFGGGFCAGLLSLVFYDGWLRRQQGKALIGPGAASAAEFELTWVGRLSPGHWLSLLIATGIGLHNFSEGLAIGQSAARGATSLALVLIIGFGLHNATEGFGIVAPLTGGDDRPSWGFLGLLGLIGGAPTFVGTVLGQSFTSQYLSVAFLALAAGSILYVVLELASVNRRLGSKAIVTCAMLFGLLLGFGTDFVLIAAGA
jgi:ZIP family zinc transporter